MISRAELKRFRAIGHKLKPVVTVKSKVLTEAVMDELNRALEDHELIKIRIQADDRADRLNTIEKISDQAHTEIIQTIGNVALLFRRAANPDPKLSNLLRF